MLLFVGAGSKQSMENWCMRKCDCNLSLRNILLKQVIFSFFQKIFLKAFLTPRNIIFFQEMISISLSCFEK